MYRVELKVKPHAHIFPFALWFLMYRVELKAKREGESIERVNGS